MIPYSKQLIEEDDIKAVIDALKSTHLTQGNEVEDFENELASYIGANYVVVFNSATSALYALYSSLGFGKEDEILTTPISFCATSNMLLALGAKPIFCDCLDDGNISTSSIEQNISSKTKAIVVVDFGGNPVNYDEISKVADKNGITLISDSSHALGSTYKGIKLGNQSKATIFSFHAIKPITTGEGGAIATNDKDIFEKAKKIRSHGVVKKALWNSDVESLGFNFRLTDFACALGRNQLKKLDNFIQKREIIAKFYDVAFKDNIFFKTIPISENNKSSRHLYPILLNQNFWCQKEDIFAKLLESRIGVQVHYKPIYQFSLYKKLHNNLFLEGAENFYKSEISIPCHQDMNLDDAKFVAEKLLEILESFSSSKCYR